MIAGYFDDVDATLKQLQRVIAPGATCAFVVGNSRWGGVVVPVDHILIMLAEKHGFEPQKILVTRYKGNSPQQNAERYGKIPVESPL